MSLLPTVSWFDEEAQATQGIVEEFGEEFTLQPYKSGGANFPRVVDLSRKGYDFQAVFERTPKEVGLGMEEVNVSTSSPCLTALICDVPGIQQGDRVLRKLNGELFEITDVKPDGLSGVEMPVVQLGRAKL
jgi:hypothetical protein